jgi:hypothetical protein
VRSLGRTGQNVVFLEEGEDMARMLLTAVPGETTADPRRWWLGDTAADGLQAGKTKEPPPPGKDGDEDEDLDDEEDDDLDDDLDDDDDWDDDDLDDEDDDLDGEWDDDEDDDDDWDDDDDEEDDEV